MSFLAALGAIGASSAMNMLGDRMQYSYDKRLMREQMKLNREQEEWSALNLPSLRRTGYEDAGYNPLLAFSSNFGAAPGVSQSGFSSHLNSSGFTSAMEAITGREQAVNQRRYQDAVIENQKAEIENKKAQTDILKAQAEETRLNNAETRRITEDRNKMNHVVDLLRQRIDYIRSGAGTTRTSVSFPGFFNRSETRDNSDAAGTIKALDLMIQKYGGGIFDALDRDIQFDTLLGGQSAIERDIAKYNRDRNDRIRENVQRKLDVRNMQLDDYYKQQKKQQKKRKQENKRKDYRYPKPPPPQSLRDYNYLYEIPGMSLIR